jgi:deoxycytidylate deaminase
MDFEREGIEKLQKAGHSNLCACPDCTVHIIATLVRRVIKEELEKYEHNQLKIWDIQYGPRKTT